MKSGKRPWFAPPGRWLEAPWYHRKWREAMAEYPVYPGDRFSGRGIVFSAGGERLFTNLWVNLCLLRRIHRCTLPVEVWYFGDREMTPGMRALLGPFDVRLVNGEAHARDLPAGTWRGFALKSLAVVHNRFREVLFLDTDSHPMRDPSFLFEERAYRWTGSCFWPNIWRTDPGSKFWRALDLPFVEEEEWESGQLVFDKKRCWRALSLVEHLNRHFNYYYQHVYGDAMTFYGAWKAAGQPYAMTPYPAKAVSAPDGRSLLKQFDFEGGLLFQHRTCSDWILDPGKQSDGPRFLYEEACGEFLRELDGKWPAAERDCAENAGEKRCGGFPSVWQRLGAVRPRTRPPVIAPLPAAPPPPSGPWKSMAYQVLKSPAIASPRLMGTGIESLRDSPDLGTARAILGFFAALIFVDPRLGAMLPDVPEVEGTELQGDWEKLEKFRQLATRLQGTTGLLPVRGNGVFPISGAEPTPVEAALVQHLEAFLNGPDQAAPDREAGPAGFHPPAAKAWRIKPLREKVLVLTPVKNAADLAEDYVARLAALAYPPELLSIGLLESDSRDGTFEAFDRALDVLRPRWGSVGIWKQDFHYSIPEGCHRWQVDLQLKRRGILAHSRNELLRRALRDEDRVLWLDADVIEYPRDIIEQLLSYGKEILHPHCVLKYGGGTFDRNAWRERGAVLMEQLRGREILAPLDAVGGTMLWIHADLHRKGLIFPPEPYGGENPRCRRAADCYDPGNPGEIETEGLGLMASDMNVQCWGLPGLEILHRKK